MALAQRQTFRPMEENGELRKKIHDQLIPGKDAKNTQGDRIVSSTNCVGKTGYPHAKLYNWILITRTKVNSKWIIDLNVRPETVKLLENKKTKNHKGKAFWHWSWKCI